MRAHHRVVEDAMREVAHERVLHAVLAVFHPRPSDVSLSYAGLLERVLAVLEQVQRRVLAVERGPGEREP